MSRAVPTHRVAVGARLGAVALPPGTRGVGEYRGALGHGAPFEPVHAAAHQVEGGADGDQRGQHGAEGLAVVAVVQMPAVARVVGQPGVGGGLGQHPVEQFGALVLVVGVHDRLPRLKGRPDSPQIVRCGRALQRQPGGGAAVGQLRGAGRGAVGEVRCQVHGVRAVRVEVHKPITPI